MPKRADSRSLLPFANGQTNVVVTNGHGDPVRTVSSAPADGSLVIDGRSISGIRPAMMTSGDLMSYLNGSGIVAQLDRYGRLVLPNATTVTGDAALLALLGL